VSVRFWCECDYEWWVDLEYESADPNVGIYAGFYMPDPGPDTKCPECGKLLTQAKLDEIHEAAMEPDDGPVFDA
jgi:hypothetical protein